MDARPTFCDALAMQILRAVVTDARPLHRDAELFQPSAMADGNAIGRLSRSCDRTGIKELLGASGALM
jgi:hypothetical protein